MVSSLNFSDNFSKNSEIISSFLSISLIQILTLSVVLESDISEIRTLGSNILISNLSLNNILMLDNSNNFEIYFFFYSGYIRKYFCMSMCNFFNDFFDFFKIASIRSVSYTHLRAHETRHDLVCRLLL